MVIFFPVPRFIHLYGGENTGGASSDYEYVSFHLRQFLSGIHETAVTDILKIKK
jgi:hypothetical protein